MSLRATRRMVITVGVMVLCAVIVAYSGRAERVVDTRHAVQAAARQTEAPPQELGGDSDGDLVGQLQTLLSHHATLAMRFTRATLTNDPDFVDTADEALVRNTADLEAALRPAIGADQASTFGDQWEAQTRALFQCATGIRDDRPATIEQAREQLARYVSDQSSLLATASDGRIAQGDVAGALEAYVDDQIAQIERYGERDFEQSYQLQREAFADMFPVGRTVGKVAGPLRDPRPADELQTALAMMLGEHVELAVDTMRAGVTGAPDFEAAAAALDANTTDVANAMDTLFGAKQAQQFNAVWADHINLFVDYTVAVAENDTATKERVRRQFDPVMRRFGTTLAAATDGLVDAKVVTEAMSHHEDQLIDQIEQYAEDDYREAHNVSYAAYQHIRGVSDVLAVAFAKAADLPRGGAQTGAGGMAGR